MGLEGAVYINTLDDNWPLGGDPTNRGDDHLRLIKAVLKSTFPGDAGVGFDIPITATEVELNYVGGVTGPLQAQIDAVIATATGDGLGLNPIGAVIMFNAAFSGIPVNWQLCDGTNGTPDMTNQFVYGTNNEGDLLNAGGQADAIIPDHTHPAVAGHTHTYDTKTSHGARESGGATHEYWRQLGNVEGNGTSSNSGAHSHDSPLAAESVTDKNLPPFIKLAFIQRMT